MLARAKAWSQLDSNPQHSDWRSTPELHGLFVQFRYTQAVRHKILLGNGGWFIGFGTWWIADSFHLVIYTYINKYITNWNETAIHHKTQNNWGTKNEVAQVTVSKRNRSVTALSSFPAVWKSTFSNGNSSSLSELGLDKSDRFETILSPW